MKRPEHLLRPCCVTLLQIYDLGTLQLTSGSFIEEGQELAHRLPQYKEEFMTIAQKLEQIGR